MKKTICLLFLLVSLIRTGSAQNQPEYAIQDYPQQKAAGSKFFLGLASGINNYTGLIGPTLEYRLSNKLAAYGGVGLGTWGSKLSAGLKFYPEFPGGWAFNLGFSHATGLDRIELDMPAEHLYSGVETKVPFKLKGANTVNLSAVKYWMLGRTNRNRFNLEFGYAIPVAENQYEILSSDQLNPTGKYFMNFMQPGGLILGLGFSFGV